MIHRSIGAVSHGIIDYALVILLAVGPSFFVFAGRQATWSYIFAAVLFVMAVLTRYPLGVIKIVGLGIHERRDVAAFLPDHRDHDAGALVPHRFSGRSEPRSSRATCRSCRR
jgi:hypothetical protein